MNSQKDAGAEALALQAVEQHHAEMSAHLKGLVEAVVDAVETGDPDTVTTARDVLLDWCEAELVPHALAEEGPLYSGAGRTEAGRLLVEGMLEEHRVIVGLVEELRLSQGVPCAITAGAIERIFSLHLGKENRLLMPLIMQSPGLSLADSVAGLHELVGTGGHLHDQDPHDPHHKRTGQ
jgi:hypothetical protein